MTDTPILELTHVSRTFGAGETEVHALYDVSLSVASGEMVAVMGPSGSGKSTLLALAGTLERPSSGSVAVDGADVASLSRAEVSRLRRRTIGFVFQDLNLLPGLSAIENVSLPLELDGLRTGAARDAAGQSLATVGLAERADHFPDQLSGGERQRVAIARAVTGGRHLLLADEPSGSLDQSNAESVMGQIRAACHAGVAAVVVTHDAHLAAMADRVVHLLDGRLTNGSAAR
ncbi:MAG TPA: ABC transporter ATP-binding protein [Acidimicrobiales bacterium]|nr:ABC transporter ATP-binding protein [Acidimicrobiales bacterium]